MAECAMPMGSRPRRPAVENRHPETRERLLSAALFVFAERGFERATVKDITDGANANIAAVNYHFGSKESLIRQVLETFLRPVNQARLAALDACERRTKGQAGLRDLIEALV